MGQTITFELNGKTYLYPYVTVNTPNKNFWGDSKIIRGDFISLFDFLELEKKSYSNNIKVNGVSGIIRVTQYNYEEGTTVWHGEITCAGNSINFASKPDNDVFTPVPAIHYSDSAITYNYYLKEWGYRQGPQSFKTKIDGKVNSLMCYYNKDSLYGNGVPESDERNLKANILYKARYFASNLADYYTSRFFRDSNLTRFMNGLDYVPPTYPNQNPDGDDDTDGQPEQDAPVPGDGDTSSEAIPDPPPLPNVDVTDTGFVTVYNPNVIEIRQLAYFMWSGDFVDLIKKMFAEPFSALISLKLIYAPVITGNNQVVWLGNVETGVSMKKVTQQFIDIDMGKLTISEFFGSFADYAPYTKVQIFLPFIGYKDLNVDEVMNAIIHLRYRIDVYSGACIAFLTITKDIKSTKLNSILYQFDGNCSMEIPFTSNDNSRYVAAILNATTQGALSLASSSSVSPPKPQDPFVKEPNTASFNLGSLAPVANGMLDILSVKPNVARSGSLAGAIASMGVKQPYVIIHRPIQHMPANYQKYYGIPLNLTRTLSELSGYTVVSQVFIESAGATDEEVQMITTLLRSGVIL